MLELNPGICFLLLGLVTNQLDTSQLTVVQIHDGGVGSRA